MQTGRRSIPRTPADTRPRIRVDRLSIIACRTKGRLGKKRAARRSARIFRTSPRLSASNVPPWVTLVEMISKLNVPDDCGRQFLTRLNTEQRT